jgi:surfactin synthase thioesterase subunit
VREAWFTRIGPRRDGPVILCFPHAGAGPSVYRTWLQYMPEDVELQAVHLPGREKRLQEPRYRELPPLIAAVADGCEVLRGRQIAFFGHSLGALLAFELARVLSGQGSGPVCLAVSAAVAPHLLNVERPSSYQYPDDELLAGLLELGYLPEPLRTSPEFIKMFLPLLKDDFAIGHGYRYQPGEPLACPLLAFGGDADLTATVESVDAWRQHTRAAFSCTILSGGHFYLTEYLAQIIGPLVTVLRASMA